MSESSTIDSGVAWCGAAPVACFKMKKGRCHCRGARISNFKSHIYWKYSRSIGRLICCIKGHKPYIYNKNECDRCCEPIKGVN